jgi:hypothetical protein
MRQPLPHLTPAATPFWTALVGARSRDPPTDLCRRLVIHQHNEVTEVAGHLHWCNRNNGIRIKLSCKDLFFRILCTSWARPSPPTHHLPDLETVWRRRILRQCLVYAFASSQSNYGNSDRLRRRTRVDAVAYCIQPIGYMCHRFGTVVTQH